MPSRLTIPLRLFLGILIASVLALSSHIYISSLTRPVVGQMANGFQFSPTNYPTRVIVASYITAFIGIAFHALVYYFSGHVLLRIKSKFMRATLLSVILLSVKGLIRKPIVEGIYVNYLGMKNPLAFEVLNHIDIWVATFLVGFCLVYLCPIKYKSSV